VPNWLLIILVIMGVFLLGGVLVIVWATLRPTGRHHHEYLVPIQQGPEWSSYKSDTFDGVLWRWKYSQGYSIDSLHPLCPHDYTDLVSRDFYNEVLLQCETCQKQFGPFPGDRQYLQGRIERQIIRKTRTGEWKTTSGTATSGTG
jgi:hypothetical protein